MSYAQFLDGKRQLGGRHGFEPRYLPDFLFSFQRDLVAWAIRQGRAGIFADCGLGKTPMQLVWARNVEMQAGRVLILTPLAVSDQTVAEAHKFGIEAARSKDGKLPAGIVVTNYESLHHFNPEDFSGVVCDESSILKNFDGVRRAAVTEFMRRLPFRLLCTATAAPNDYIELGTSSEALGELGYTDMLGRFFKNDQNAIKTNRNWSGAQWRFKRHAELPFWRWVASWARACRRPSDLGHPDDAFILPQLVERETVVTATKIRPGFLFEVPAQGLWEEREELRRTITERCEAAAAKVGGAAPAVVWCHLNKEADLLEKLIPGSRQVSGNQSDDEKEELFKGFAAGQVRVLITKPKIGAWGLNWQHCARMTVFPSHSFEQYYQAVRRCWRFGQTRTVEVEVITTKGQKGVLANLRAKSAAADRMFEVLVAQMGEARRLSSSREFREKMEVPSWL